MSLKQSLVSLLAYLLILRKKLWMVGVILALIVGLTAYNTYRQVPVYQATCKIVYKKANPAAYLTAGSPLYYLNPYFDAVSFETEKHIITSPLMAEKVVETLGLASPENSSRWKSWVKRVQGSLSVSKLKDTRIYLITSRATDPDLTQALANTAAAVYIDFNLKEKQESAEKILTVLTEQINELKVKIHQSEMDKIKYVKRVGEVPIDGTYATAMPGSGLGSYQEGRLLDELRSQLVRQEIKREELLNRYMEKHPRVREVERQIQVLNEKIERENERIIQIHKEAIEYGILEKDAQANQDAYKVLIEKLKDLNISDSGIESGIEIIEKAERPVFPIAPRKTRNLSLSIILGLILGLGAVFISEYFDSSLQTPAEAESYLSLPVLATISRIKSPGKMSKEEASKFSFLVSEMAPTSHEAEMFKNLRTNIRFSDPEAKRISLLVTSSGPREGKSTVSTNLAITTAYSGLNTILVDADMRRPILHKVFTLDNTTGMSTYLKGEISLEEIIFPTFIERLFVIPSGPVPSNPSELLESPRMPEFIHRLKDLYDRVIFDSPPAGALADSSIIAGLVDGAILVCFSGQIARKYILQTKHQLEKTGVRIFGVVLNCVSLKLRSYYHFYYGIYKYGYHT